MNMLFNVTSLPFYDATGLCLWSDKFARTELSRVFHTSIRDKLLLRGCPGLKILNPHELHRFPITPKQMIKCCTRLKIELSM